MLHSSEFIGTPVGWSWLPRLAQPAMGKMIVLEVKDQDSQQNRTEREFRAEWVKAVNAHSGFGQWASDVSFDPADIPEILVRHAANEAG